ncbi:hypothetical protein IscW_ISCW002694 [Ixodes scapularis]|uniref:Uncharacterized protein n=1 Tax=Ixodes scapularis TaxID=6945 RepID=B7PD09_IXOSC|nr:hypothetical protein IscW_ISCW002694 [Ixodes scapularis]|eukprot:XP_002410554.1 hypothetical protein IscW_ISCW002694 [Ixodes scapularis]
MLNSKPILCTLSNEVQPGPQDGVCDIIFLNFFYAPGKGTFRDKSAAVFQWFLGYARNNSALTEYGLGIDHG